MPNKNVCAEAKFLVENMRYNLAYTLMMENRNKDCLWDNNNQLIIDILCGTGHYREALLEIDKLPADVQAGEAIVQQRARLQAIILKEDVQLGAQILNLQKQNSPANEMICFQTPDSLFVLDDSPIVRALYPRKIVQSNTYHFASAKLGTRSTEWLSDEARFDRFGPATRVGDTLIFLSVVRKTAFGGSHGAIHEIITINPKNGKTLDLELIEENSSVLHPAFRKREIIFASEMPGGYGGMDLWRAELAENGKEFGAPQNLGPEINTAFNEVYPSWIGDTLYYTSDRIDKGYGGFDIYRVGFGIGTPENLSAPINSPYDDFQAIGKDNLDYFVSNRSGGLGGDDIYHLKRAAKKLFFNQLMGKIDANGSDLKGQVVEISNPDRSFVELVNLDENGYFQIANVKGLEDYNVKLVDFELQAGAKLSMFDEKGALLKEVQSGSNGSFKIELLAPQDYFITRIANADESVLSVDILGMLSSNDKTEEGLKIFLEDSDGNLIGLTKTDSSGNFVFESVLPDARYTIRSEITDPNAVINVMGKDGQTIQTIAANSGKGAVYIRLSEDDHIITLTNATGKKVRVSERELFNLPILYFDTDKARLSPDSKQSLDYLVSVMVDNEHIALELSGHTDSRGSAIYNLTLSQKRIDAVVEYMMQAGVAADRMKGRGYGEQQLLNNCVDDKVCSEEEHALNRRTEIRILEINEP